MWSGNLGVILICMQQEDIARLHPAKRRTFFPSGRRLVGAYAYVREWAVCPLLLGCAPHTHSLGIQYQNHLETGTADIVATNETRSSTERQRVLSPQLRPCWLRKVIEGAKWVLLSVGVRCSAEHVSA